MKKILLSIIAIAFFSFANAQITLTSTDAPSIGDVFVSVNDTNSYLTTTPGADGSNVTWDFSSLQNNGYDTTLFVDPASTPYASTFPSSNLAQEKKGVYNFLNKTSSFIEVQGGLFNDTLAVEFADYLTVLQFPFTYNDNFSDDGLVDIKLKYDTTITVGGFPVTIDSIRFKRNIYTTKTATAWGALTTPTNTYNDVLKLKTHELDVDSMWMHTSSLGWVSAQNSKDSTDTYDWFANGLGTPMLTMTLKHDTVTNIQYYHSTITSVNNNTFTNSNSKIYPNPAKDKLFIENSTKINSVVIFDITGKEVVNKSQINKQQTIINTSKLDKGIYLYIITDVNGNTESNKFIKN